MWHVRQIICDVIFGFQGEPASRLSDRLDKSCFSMEMKEISRSFSMCACATDCSEFNRSLLKFKALVSIYSG